MKQSGAACATRRLRRGVLVVCYVGIGFLLVYAPSWNGRMHRRRCLVTPPGPGAAEVRTLLLAGVSAASHGTLLVLAPSIGCLNPYLGCRRTIRYPGRPSAFSLPLMFHVKRVRSGVGAGGRASAGGGAERLVSGSYRTDHNSNHNSSSSKGRSSPGFLRADDTHGNMPVTSSGAGITTLRAVHRADLLVSREPHFQSKSRPSPGPVSAPLRGQTPE